MIESQKVSDCSLHHALQKSAMAVNEEMEKIFSHPRYQHSRLYEVMRYATIGKGKKLRPFLVIETAKMLNVSRQSALRVAAAVEFLHTYSLIHDDLPCMDNSNMRRGQPSCHIAFDEATAVLAGDGLLTYAFEILSSSFTHADAQVRIDLIAKLAAATGPHGMVEGQMLDLQAMGQKEKMAHLNIGAITRMQRLKTGELFAFCCEAAAILGNRPLQIRQALNAFAHDVGLAFQITDDLLDVEGEEEALGKPIGQDKKNKVNFVHILGLERAKQQAYILADQAIEHLSIFDESAAILRDFARYVVERKN